MTVVQDLNAIWGRNVSQRRHDEDDLQRICCQFMDVSLPSDALYFAIPNGGKRHPREAARLKGLGVVAGVPHLCVVHRGRAMFVELKAPKGLVSAAQKALHKRLIYCGAEVMLVRSVEQLEAQLREACVPLRATVAA